VAAFGKGNDYRPDPSLSRPTQSSQALAKGVMGGLIPGFSIDVPLKIFKDQEQGKPVIDIGGPCIDLGPEAQLY